MQVVLLGAGNSSRFYPYLNYGHKSFFPLFDKPIIYHTLKSIQRSGIKNVVVVVKKAAQFKELMSKCPDLQLEIKIVEQPQALGMGDALLQARDFLEDEFFVMHAHHVDFPEFKEVMINEKVHKDQTVLLAKKERDISKFGVLKVEHNRVLQIIEKPRQEDQLSNLRLVGIYLIPLKFLEILEQSKLEHYNFESSLSNFAKNNLVSYVETHQESISLKYPWDIFSVKKYLFNSLKRYISNTAEIAVNSTIDGDVIIEEGAKIMENAVLKGPVYIGRRAVVGNNAILREGTILSENCIAGANMEIRNSIISSDTHFHSGFVGDSVFGQHCRVGAGFNTGNKRFDRQEVIVKIGENVLNTGVKNLGVIAGDNIKIGINVSSLPGSIIGNNTIVGPNTMIKSNIPDKTRYYTKFQEIVSSTMED